MANVLPIRPGAYAVVSMDDGRIVLVRKTRGPLVGKFDLPGGGIDHGESHIEAVTRELREELGLSVHTAKLFDVFHDVVVHDKPEGIFQQHLLGIVHTVSGVTSEEFDESVTEWGDDAGEIVRLPIGEALKLDLTPIAKKALLKFTLA